MENPFHQKFRISRKRKTEANRRKYREALSDDRRALISELLQVKEKQEISSRDNLGKGASKLKPWKKNGHSISKGSDIKKCEDIATKVWKYNLVCLVLMRLNMLQLSLKPDQRDWELIEKGQRGRRMLTWHQLRTNKGLSCKGRKAKWFMLVEKKLLKEERSREVKVEFIVGPLLVAKENSYWDVRRVVRKEQGTILTEHWARDVSIVRGADQKERSIKVGKRREVEEEDMLELPQRLEE
ncbi:19521_t:CDS:2, partial [Gigaspora rosea]